MSSHYAFAISTMLALALSGCASTPLLDAVYRQQYKAVVQMVEAGKEDINTKDGSDRTPLIIAAYYNYSPILEYLVNNGAKLDEFDTSSKTALHYAVRNGSLENARLLLEKGADPNIEDYEGNTPIFNAAYYNRIELVKLLLLHGAYPNVRNNAGYTPYYYAKQYDYKAIKALLEPYK